MTLFVLPRRLAAAFVFTILYFLFSIHSPLYARGLGINVSVIKLAALAPGVEINVGKAIAERIIVRNTSDEIRKYSIAFHKPSQIEVKWNSLRYEEIPDVGWLRTPHKEIILAANSEKAILVYLKVPRRRQYYSKRYCAVMAVSEIPQDDATIPIILAVYPLIEIETMSKAGLRIKD